MSAADWRYQTYVKKCDVFPLVLLRLFSGLEILVYHRSLYHKGVNFVLINQNIFFYNIQLWVMTWCTWSPSDINECSQITIDEHASCSNIEGSYIATVAPVTLCHAGLFQHIVAKRLISPAQFCPFPVYPAWHWHTCDPRVFVHVAFTWQEWFSLHSSISVKS